VAYRGAQWRDEEGSGLFTGEYQHSLDAKGRIILPARIRSQLESGLVIHKWFDRCLAIVTPEEFESYAARVREGARANDPAARSAMRWLFSGAHEDHVDKQGRITVPEFLREWAGLEREITVVGTGPRVEVWDRQRWVQGQPEVEAAMEGVTDLPL
jgi:MraZ protein